MARPSSAVKPHTSIATTMIAFVEVFETFGLSSVLPGSSFITPVAFAMASTPESASTTPTNDFQFFQKPPVSGCVIARVTASPRCGMQNSASSTTTMAVGTETRNARPPVCLGPKILRQPMNTTAPPASTAASSPEAARHPGDIGTPRAPRAPP